MSSDVTTLDHVAINVRAELDDAVRAYQRLGFRLTTRGHHSIGSSNNLAVFQENYLELLGFEAEAKAVGIGEALIAGPIGLNSVAFRTEDGEHTFQSLMKRNVPAIPPETFSRPVELPNGTFDARFTVVRLEAKNLSTPNLFYCHHLTPELVWRCEWLDHANGAIGIAHLVVAAADPTSYAECFRHLIGAEARHHSDSIELSLGSARLLVLSHKAAFQWSGGAMVSEDRDRIVGLGIRTRSFELVDAALSTGGVGVASRDRDRIIVSAEHAFGVVMEFVL